MGPIRVLYYEYPGPGLGGSRRSLLNLLRGLDGEVEAYVVGNLPEEVAQALPKKATLAQPSYAWPPEPGRQLSLFEWNLRWWYYFLSMAIRLAFLIVRRGIHVVHVNNDATSGAPAILAAIITRRLCVCHLRGTEPPWRETRWLFRHVDHYIAISDHVREYYALQHLLDGASVSVIFNGVDVKDLGECTRTGSVPPSDCFTACMLGRLIEYKGCEYFLEVAREAASRHTGGEFAIYAPVPEPGEPNRSYYERLCEIRRLHGLEKRVRFVGPYSDVAEVLRGVDAVLCCSPFDNFGRILFEAMACGVPVVAFDSGGTREVGVSGQNCLLVPNRDVSAMAEALHRLITDKSLRDNIVRGGRETARQLFDYKANAHKVLAVYQQLLASQPRGSRPVCENGRQDTTGTMSPGHESQCH